MDLKSGKLFWPEHSRTPNFPRLLKDVRCDVAIIGAGLSGAMIAHALSREGLDVVVLEKRAAGHGSTSASTALVLYEIDVPLVDLIRQRGRASAVQSYHRCRAAIDELSTLVRQLGGSCGFRKRGSLYLASEPKDLRKLRKEFLLRKKTGFKVRFMERDEIETLFSFTAPGAIYSEEAAEVNPFHLTTLLLERSVRLGARVFSETECERFSETLGGVTIHTTKNTRIHAGHLVMASGFETKGRAVKRIVSLKSSYAMVTRPVTSFKGWHKRCLIWETKRPYLYMRTTEDNRIVIGGEDEDFLDARKRDRLIKRKCAVLSEKLERMFPSIEPQPEYAWAGTFGETKDGLPYIGAMKPQSRVLYALCYGANGTNFAVIAADIIRDLIFKRPNKHARVFGFNRE